MILALDDDVSPDVESAIRDLDGMDRGRSASAETDDGYSLRLRRRSRRARRHAGPGPARESEFIVEGRFQGHAETPLSAVGLRQAALVGERLAHPHDPPALPLPDGPLREIVHSPLRRTAQTAEAIEGRLPAPPPLRAEPGLIEIGQGEEGLHRDEVSARYGRRSRRGGTRRRRHGRPAASRSARCRRGYDRHSPGCWPRSPRAASCPSTVRTCRATSTPSRPIHGRSRSPMTACSRSPF